MFNHRTIKESDSFTQGQGYYCTVQMIDIDEGYIIKDGLPCWYLVGVVGFIDYQDKWVGEVKHFHSASEAEKAYSDMCLMYHVSEQEDVIRIRKGCADDNEYHARIGGGQ